MTGRILPLILFPVLIGICVILPRSLAFLPAVIALLAYLTHAVRFKEWLMPDKYLSLFFAAITALSFLSYLWAEFPDNVLSRSYSTAGIMFSGFILLAAAKNLPGIEEWPLRKLALVCSATAFSAALFLFLENQFNYPVGRAIQGDEFLTSLWNRSNVVLAGLLAPCIFLLHKTFGLTRNLALYGGLLTIVFVLAMVNTQSQTASIMALAGLTGYFAACYWRKYLLIITSFAVVILTMAAPLIPGPLQKSLSGVDNHFIKSASMPHRLEVWNFMAEKIQERPLLGHGIESVRSMKSEEIMPHIQSDTILHPHNAFLQVWVETGLAGALLACALMLFILRRISQSDAQSEPLYYAVFVSSLSLLSTGYGLWQGWQIGLLLSLSALSILFARIWPPVKS